MDLGIAGRVCLVTGAAGGIGLETARLLRAEDAKVVLVAPEAGPLDDAAAGLDGGADELATLPLALGEPDAGEQLLGAALEAFGGIDVLVNVAGGAPRREGFEASDVDWRARYEANVMAPLRAMKAVAPALAERGWGRIVNVCSALARHPSQTMPERSVAEASELALSRLFAERYAKQGVLVNALCPPTDAPAAEVAATVVFLCSERASYVAGAAWPAGPGAARASS